MSPDEQPFIREALKRVDRAEKIQRIRRIVFTVLAFAAAGWLASKKPSPELGVECTVVIFAGLIAAICTAKIKSHIDANTKLVLRAIAELEDERAGARR